MILTSGHFRSLFSRLLHDRTHRRILIFLLVAYLALSRGLVFSVSLNSAFDSTTADVRTAVQQIFEQLKSGQYAELYEALPLSSQKRITRDRFIKSLESTRDLYALDRLEIGKIVRLGQTALVDTTLYARLYKPVEANGKLVIQQHLIREGDKWRVATGDPQAKKDFIETNPKAGKYLHETRVFMRQGERWIDVSNLLRQR